MNRILELDYRNRRALVEPGVINLDLSTATLPHGYQYVPDPSSQKACTIGGNVAENSGGPHCLAYGVTTNHVLALEVVLPDGDVIWTGGPGLDAPGYDLTGVIVGSEGTLGIVTKALVRLMRVPEAVRVLLAQFNGVVDASNTVSAVIARGHRASRDGDDGPARLQRGRGRLPRRLPGRRRGRATHRGGRARDGLTS